MYANSLTPSRLFSIGLRLFSVAALLMWLGFLIDPDEIAFDLGGWIVLGTSLCAFIFSVLFSRRVRWVRIIMSIVLHALVLIAIVGLPSVILSESTIAEKMAVAAP